MRGCPHGAERTTRRGETIEAGVSEMTEKLLPGCATCSARGPHRRQRPALVDMDTGWRAGRGPLLRGSAAYRYLPLRHEREGCLRRAPGRSTTPCTSFAAPDPSRLDHVVPESPSTTSTTPSRRCSRGRRRMGGKSLQLPVFPAELGLPDYYHEKLRPAAGRHPGDRQCRSAATSASTPMLEDLQKAKRKSATYNAGRRCGQHAVDRPEARVRPSASGSPPACSSASPISSSCSFEPGAWAWNRPGGSTSPTTSSARQGYRGGRTSRELPSFYFHRQGCTPRSSTRDRRPCNPSWCANRLGTGKTSCGSSDYPHPVSSWPHSPQESSTRCSRVCPRADRTLMVSENAKRVWEPVTGGAQSVAMGISHHQPGDGRDGQDVRGAGRRARSMTLPVSLVPRVLRSAPTG